MKKKSKKTEAQLKRDLDALYSRYIRLKSAQDGICICYTCGRRLGWKQAQCGHFIPRNFLITRWDERNTKVQCVGCNIFGRGKILDFEDHLIKELGQEEVNKLKASRFKVFKVDSIWYSQKIEEYKNKLSMLE